MYYTTIPKLIDAYRTMKNNPEQTFEILFPGWFSQYWKYSDFLRWFRLCLHNKINREIVNQGRCYNNDWQLDMEKDARIIKDYFSKRIRNSGAGILNTLEMKRKYPFINNPFEFER